MLREDYESKLFGWQLLSLVFLCGAPVLWGLFKWMSFRNMLYVHAKMYLWDASHSLGQIACISTSNSTSNITSNSTSNSNGVESIWRMFAKSTVTLAESLLESTPMDG